MNCQICLEKYNIFNRIPKNLKCGHTFCERCLKKLGDGYEIECPKCRTRSRNNLPICYAIYEQLLQDEKSDTDEPCKYHEYEKVNYYCNDDKITICSICLLMEHKDHNISLYRDKYLTDENLSILIKWKDYFIMKKEEYNHKKDILINIMKECEAKKNKLSKDVTCKYESLLLNFNNMKSELVNEIDQLYNKELKNIQCMKVKIDSSINKLSKFVQFTNFNTDDYFNYVNITEIRDEHQNTTKLIEHLFSEKNQMKFKDIKWSEELLFSKVENTFDINYKKFSFSNNIFIFGDSKDHYILNFDLKDKQFNKMELVIGSDYEFMDYCCVVKYCSDSFLITGGCNYVNFRNTARKKTFIAKIISKTQLSICEFKSLNIERFSHGSLVVNGNVYVFGGHNGVHTLASTEYYDDKEGLWKVLPDMNVEREIFAYCSVKDRYIYVFGGFGETHLDNIERFDTVRLKWKLINLRLKLALQNASAVNINDEYVAIIGGYNGILHKTIFMLNLNLMNWNNVEYYMKVARRRAHCFKYEDSIYIFGGETPEIEEHQAEVFDIKMSTISFLSNSEKFISKPMNFWSSSKMD